MAWQSPKPRRMRCFVYISPEEGHEVGNDAPRSVELDRACAHAGDVVRCAG
jgi:hypothetical protein